MDTIWATSGMKQKRDIKYLTRNARCAESAARAKLRGENGRSILLFDSALDFAIDALDQVLKGDPVDRVLACELYEMARHYALECGRNEKAQHLERELAQFLEAAGLDA